MKRRTQAQQWFENDDFWRTTFPFMFPESAFTVASETVRKILRMTKVRGKTALDLCCGPGRFSIALAKRGFAVTGVDRTRYLLDKARARARASRVAVEWIRQDMRDFVRPDAYHLAISTYTSFGYFQNREDDTAVLANVFRSLRPGGVFLLEMLGREILAKIFLPVSADTHPDGSILIERRSIVEDWTRIRNEWILIKEGIAKKFLLQLNLYSGQELRQRMEHVGFTDVRLYGSLDGIPYGPDAKRLIAIGRRPRS
jgi:ubiquinone/menaquinone biosynthesis C-methylase UbiE